MSRPLVNIHGELLQQGYVLLGKLARGETSTVYEAQHEATRRRVAIKVTSAETHDADRIAGRLMTAWNVARGLRHPHVISVLDGGRFSDGRAYLVMERLRGRDLQMELDEVGRLPVSRAMHILRQVCEALQVLHRRGAVHRDVNPQNIYLSSAGHFADHAKLIDLGRISVGEDDPHRVHAPTGPIMLGTPLYLPPELARGEAATPASDFYSVGAVLYHLVVGRPPFEDNIPTRLIAKHVNEPVPPLPGDISLPRDLSELMLACLEKAPRLRPQDADPVIRTFDACLMALSGVNPAATSSEEPPERSRSRSPMPKVPAAGLVAEWQTFADGLRRVVRQHYPKAKTAPPAVSEALSWVSGARSALDEKIDIADRQRAVADNRARARIAARQRLEQRLDALEQALARAETMRHEAEHSVFAMVRARERIDARYHETLRSLGIADSAAHGAHALHELRPLVDELRALLAQRAETDARVRGLRETEREAAEQIALLMAERLEVYRAHADVELEERDEGQRFEWLAAKSGDEVLAAQRAFENACMNLYLRCIELSGTSQPPRPRGPEGS